MNILLIRILAWFYAATLVFFTVCAPGARIVMPIPHELEHLVAFLASGVLFSIAYPSSRFPLILVAGVGFTAGLEILQIFVPGRHARWIDFVMNASGICLGLGITSLGSAISGPRRP